MNCDDAQTICGPQPNLGPGCGTQAIGLPPPLPDKIPLTAVVGAIPNPCPGAVTMPDCDSETSLDKLLKAIAGNLCPLNPKAIAAAPDCSWLTVKGGKVSPTPALDAFRCLPWSKPGQHVTWDGSDPKITDLPPIIEKITDLKDGPGVILPKGFLVGNASGTGWTWASGCLPPCPAASGLQLISTAGGGMTWAARSAVPWINNCSDLNRRLEECPPVKTGPATKVLGKGADGAVGYYDVSGGAAIAPTCQSLLATLPTCLPQDSGAPPRVLGQSADGSIRSYPTPSSGGGGGTVNCSTLQALTPASGQGPDAIWGVKSGACGSFSPRKGCTFRARISGTDKTASKLIPSWGSSASGWLAADLDQEYNLGLGAGSFNPANSTYTISEGGLYLVEAGLWINVKLAGSGTGRIHPDCIFAVIGAVAVTRSGSGYEQRLGEISEAIDYVYDPQGTVSTNNANRGYVSPGIDTYFAGSSTYVLSAGDTVRGPTARVNTVYNASDIMSTVTISNDGGGYLSITRVPIDFF